jgi:hypothetical protein
VAHDAYPAPRPRGQCRVDRHVEQLKRGHDLAQAISRRRENTPAPTGEKALRPLWYLVREERRTEIPKVWRAAVHLADGKTPSITHVKKALADWKRENVAKQEASGVKVPERAKCKLARGRWRIKCARAFYFACKPMCAIKLLKMRGEVAAAASHVPPLIASLSGTRTRRSLAPQSLQPPKGPSPTR